MAPRVDLLRAFCRGLAPGTVKIESDRFGFPFLAELLSGGGDLEYGELTPLRLVHRYKLVNVPAGRMDELLRDHVDKRYNVCRYFDPRANDVFCFNVDNNHRVDNTSPIPEMDLGVRALRQCLVDVGCDALVVASGRGYHVWGRLEAPTDNDRLFRFELAVAARALWSVHSAGRSHDEIKINLYPHLRTLQAVSLRLFGSIHAKTGRFSQVLAPEGLLDEQGSWARFDEFVKGRAMSVAAFEAACDELAIPR